MKKLVFSMLLISSVVFAQEKITMNIGDFHTLKTYRGLQIELIKSELPKVIIDGNKSSEVNVKNKNGTLKISMNLSHTFSADDVMIYLYYNNPIDIIDANEGSHIFSDEVLKQDNLTVKAQEAARVKLEIDTDELEVSAITGGHVRLKGIAKNQKVKSHTGGIYKGENLDTEYTDVSANTGGSAEVKASKNVEANASTGGTITISGDPEEVVKKESLGGYVRQ